MGPQSTIAVGRAGLIVIPLVWITARIWVIAALVVLPWVPYDVTLYESWAADLSMGRMPINDELWQYPALTAIPIVAVSWLPGSYIVNFVAVALVMDAAILLLLFWHRRAANSSLGLWVWATAGFWVGPVLLTRLDILTTLLAVAALVFLHRPIFSTLLIALGFGIKLWPGLVALAWSRRQLLKRALLLVAMALLTLLAPNLLSSESGSFLDRFAGRGLHAESVAASPYLVVRLIGGNVDFIFSSGTSEIGTSSASWMGSVVSLIGLALLVLIALLRWTDRLQGLATADVVGIGLVILIATSRILSPQFYVWTAGILAVALLDNRTRLRGFTLLIVLSAASAQYIYPLRTGFPDLDSTLVQLLRIALLVSAAAWGLVILQREATKGGRHAFVATNGRTSD